MSPKSLADLKLNDEELPAMPLDDLPTFGGVPTPPQPGAYRFRLPDMKVKVVETYEAVKDGKTVTRLKTVFSRDYPLQIVASPGGKANGEAFQTQIFGLERDRGKDKAVQASDLDYLIRALGEKTRPTKLGAYGDLLESLGGKEFGADLTLSWNCNKNRKIRVLDASGRNVEGDKEGCGRKYFQSDKTNKPDQKIERGTNGEYPVEIACSCGGIVRAFANLDNLRS
jgi:hypothetical protein